MDRLSKIKAALPVEVTGAFIAFKELFTQQYGKSTRADLMALVIALLCILNTFYYIKAVSRNVIYLLFVNFGVIVWCLNADLDRWKDTFSFFGRDVNVPDDFSTFVLPSLLIGYSLCLALFIGTGSNPGSVRGTGNAATDQSGVGEPSQ